MKEYEYDDPTGGGDNITLTGPDWLENPPPELRVTDTGYTQHVFTLIGEVDSDADDIRF